MNKIIFEIGEYVPLDIVIDTVRIEYIKHHLNLEKNNYSKVADLLMVGRATIYRLIGKNNKTERGYNSLCEFCKNKKATIRHHKLPVQNGGDDSKENSSYLCDSCHNKLHKIYLKPLQNRIIAIKNNT